jgi:hypothetical protein
MNTIIRELESSFEYDPCRKRLSAVTTDAAVLLQKLQVAEHHAGTAHWRRIRPFRAISSPIGSFGAKSL